MDDLRRIAALPGRKIISRGNHDYWWNTVTKMKQMTGGTFEFLRNNAFTFGHIAIAGTRGWIPETARNFTEEDKKIVLREEGRLERSLAAAQALAPEKIYAVLHYPPFDEERRPTSMLEIMKKYHVSDCVYGHIHGAANFRNLPEEMDGIRMHLTSADYLDFKPLLLEEI